MSIDLQTLGFTQEELQNRVVDQLCGRLMDGPICDDDGRASSGITAKINAKISAMVDEKLTAMMAATIGPSLASYIEKIVITPTNAYGERKGTPQTLVEYMTTAAAAYLNETVDDKGNGKGRDSYNWKPETTRAVWLANRELRDSIVAAMNTTLAGTNATIGAAIADAVKMSVENIKQQFHVSLPPVKK